MPETGLPAENLLRGITCSPWYEFDCVKGRELFEKSCNYKIANACGALADLYERGKGGDKDVNKAIETYEKACNLGSNEYCYILASRYERDKHAEVNIPKAKEILKKLCDKKYQDSCIRLNNIEE